MQIKPFFWLTIQADRKNMSFRIIIIIKLFQNISFIRWSAWGSVTGRSSRRLFDKILCIWTCDRYWTLFTTHQFPLVCLLLKVKKLPGLIAWTIGLLHKHLNHPRPPWPATSVGQKWSHSRENVLTLWNQCMTLLIWLYFYLYGLPRFYSIKLVKLSGLLPFVSPGPSTVPT